MQAHVNFAVCVLKINFGEPFPADSYHVTVLISNLICLFFYSIQNILARKLFPRTGRVFLSSPHDFVQQ